MTGRLLLVTALALLLVPFVAAAFTSEPALIPQSEAGTWRLDTLLDQAQVDGMEAADLDPSAFVVHEVDAEQEPPGIVAAPTAEQASVSKHDGALRLSGRGSVVAFQVTLPAGVSEQLSMVAIKARGNDLTEFAVFVGNVPTLTPGGINMRGNAPPPAAGGPPVAGQGNVVVQNFGFGDGGPVNPRDLLRRAAVTLPTAGEWHTIARTRASLMQGSGMGGFMLAGGPGAPGNRQRETPPLTIALLDPKEGASLDIAFVHVLDPRAEYAHAPAGTTVLDRDSILQTGMFLNTPCQISYRLVAPRAARLTTQVAAIDAQPFNLAVHVTAGGKRDTVFERRFALARAIEPIAVDLAAYAGKEITLSLEVLEEGGPTVAFLLQPMVLGERDLARRNAIVYFCDTLRADGLSCYGNARGTTPALDQLAADGVRFERCFSQGTWTYISMPSSLSSLPPSVSGVKRGFEQLPDKAITLAEAFRARGYLTAAFIRNDMVGRTTHTEQGFDFLFSAAAVKLAEKPVPAIPGAGGGQGFGGGFESGSSRAVYETFLPWFEKHQDVPVFVLLHAVDPHEPYEPEQADWSKYLTQTEKQRYDDEQRQLGFGGGMMGNMQFGPGGMTVREQWNSKGVDADAHVARQRALYDAEVAYFDHHLQKVIDLLQSKQLLERTVFSFNADHGEEFLEHAFTGHGHSVYAELNHVPWILRAPGLPRGKVIADNVANLDLAPTILGLCGFPPAAGMLGRDLSSALAKGEELPAVRIVTEQWGGPGSGGGQASFAVIEGRWKTIVRRDLPSERGRGLGPMPGAAPRKLPELELYDLQSDLRDAKSLLPERKDYALGAQKRFDAWLTEMEQLHGQYGSSGPESMTPEAAANLRALGYLK
ncbi:MAG: sulfatase [Planctomycetota bacterium]